MEEGLSSESWSDMDLYEADTQIESLCNSQVTAAAGASFVSKTEITETTRVIKSPETAREIKSPETTHEIKSPETALRLMTSSKPASSLSSHSSSGHMILSAASPSRQVKLLDVRE
jgi:hypothetical protein